MDSLLEELEKRTSQSILKATAWANDVLLEANGHSLEPGTFAYKQVSDGNGVGIVVATHWTGGNIVATWDGRSVATFNLYLASIKDHKNIVKIYETIDERIVLMSLDIFPRGVGNVVSFKEDLQKHPVWAAAAGVDAASS